MKGFINFIREQGVVGLAIGFIFGGSVAKVVTSIVNDLINPIVGLLMGRVKGLETAYFEIGKAKIMYGHFLSVTIDFLIISAIIYFFVKSLKLDKLDKKK